MSLLSGLLCTSLPHVGSEHFAATCENNMGASVMSQELNTTIEVDLSLDGLADQVKFVRHFSINFVKHTLANLDCVDNLNFAKTFDSQFASIVLLTT